jgi:hypothetical protein
MDDDEGSIQDITFSSGDSNASDVQLSDEERLPIEGLDTDERKKRVKYLWTRAIAKIKGAVLVLIRFGDLEKRINLFGTSIKFDFEIQHEIQPAFWIIMPNSTFKICWNAIMILLLLYTATFVPFRTAFVDKVTS